MEAFWKWSRGVSENVYFVEDEAEVQQVISRVPREPVAARTLFDCLVLPISPMQCRRASDCGLLLDSRLGCVSGAQEKEQEE